MFAVPILMIGLVVAGAVYYNMFSATFNVTPAITVDGVSGFTVPSTAIGGEPIVGDEITLTNNGVSAMEVLITDNADVSPNNGDVDVSYVGALELTKKTVNFTKDVWDILGEKVQIEYTVVGDEFSAEVIGTPISGYVLIYYKDNSVRLANPAKAILVEGNDFTRLPYVEDKNSEEADEYNYCDTEEYVTCHGAKIWYVPEGAIKADKTLDWGQASEFYFESSLIQYNAEGQITIYPSEVLDFTPVYDFDQYANGSYTITTEIK